MEETSVVDKGKGKGECEGEDEGVIWETEPEPLQAVFEPLPCIEGFLRDEYYRPFTPYTPSSRAVPSTPTTVPHQTLELPQHLRQLEIGTASPHQDRTMDDSARSNESNGME